MPFNDLPADEAIDDGRRPLVTPGEVALVGRDRDLNRLIRLLNRTAGKSGVLIAGPSGVGKTRLASEAMRRLIHRHSFIRMIPAGTGESDFLISERQTTSASVPVDQILDFLNAEEKRHRNTIFFLDDAHLLDATAAWTILEQARQGTARLLVTMNTEGSPALPVMSLWKDELLHRVDLRPLDTEASRRLATLMLEQRLAPQTSARLAQLSDGNPQLLRELVSSAARWDLFSYSSAGLTVPLTLPLSPPLQELLSQRLHGLNVSEMQSLELIALAEPIPLQTVELLSDPSVLLRLENRDLIKVEVSLSVAQEGSSTLVRIAHPLISHMIQHQTPPLRRRSHMRSLISAYVDAPKALQDTVRLTGWHLEVGETIEKERLLAAAHRASVTMDLHAAARFTGAAWEKYSSGETGAAHALTLIALGDFDRAFAVLDKAQEVCSSYSQDLLEARTRGHLLMGNFAGAQETITHAEASRRRVFEGMLAYFQGRFDSAIYSCAAATQDTTSAHRREAAIFWMAALLRAGRPDDALNVHESIAGTTLHDKTALHEDALEETYASALADLGRLKEASAILRQSYEEAIAGGRLRIDAQRGLALGAVLLERGRLRQAEELFSFHSTYRVGWRQWDLKARVLTVFASAMTGKTDNDELPEIVPSHFMLHHYVAYAWTAFLNGEREECVSLLVSAAEHAQANGAHADVAIAMHEMARLGMASRTEQFWDTPVQGQFLQARIDYARALATEDIRLLRRAAEAFSRSDAALYAAEAYAELAVLHRRTGQDRAATAATLQAKSFVSDCVGARTPPLLLLDSVHPLSIREREIVLLATQGFSDKEIAQRLTLSVRTVNNHLYRVYRKLGVSSRRELQRLADPPTFT
ncbi:LuxR C-terminal-related transcriptional regulator [Streptomyces sp. NPDC093595]|uniref:LuxR C-terminal-related transcriptional regulator n=1 Tax=Streptomyces sp. NPDC093595 TaxID=3366045 RepID=UPI0037F90A37